MNSLQIGLIAIGALVVAVLFLWHWWQSRRSANALLSDVTSRQVAPTHAEQPVTPGNQQRIDIDPDTMPPKLPGTQQLLNTVLHAGQQAQDMLEQSSHATANMLPAATRSVHDLEPIAAQSSPQQDREDTHSIVPPPTPRLISEWPFDERLHVHVSIVSLSGGAFDAASFVMAAGRASAWVRLFRQSPWEPFDPANVGSVQQLALALPLASRAGPIEAQDMDAWRFVWTQLANEQDCEAHFHGFRDAPQRANELDGFLAAVDIIPVAYLVKKDGAHWTGTRLRGTLEANGFRLQSDGRFAYHEVESDVVIFHAVDGFERPFTPERLRTEAIAALRCSIEPVRLSHPLMRYDLFRQSIRALSKLLDADIKTSEGEVLDDAMFTSMRDEVKTAMDAMASAGIEPGTDTARSLFG